MSEISCKNKYLITARQDKMFEITLGETNIYLLHITLYVNSKPIILKLLRLRHLNFQPNLQKQM